MDQKIQILVEKLGDLLKKKRCSVTTAESCTGGWIAQAMTAIPGSSETFERGFVTYSDLSKQEMLGVAAKTLEKYGAVSEQTAREMAEGALQKSNAQVSISVTGVAGPDGGSTDKPVGLVWFAWAGKNFATQTAMQNFKGNRGQVRQQAVEFALERLLQILQ